MKNQEKSVEELVKKTAEELFELLGIEATVTVESKKSEEAESTLSVNIESPGETGLLIGAHGSTLAAIQSFLGMAVRQTTGEWHRVTLDIGDWRQKHEEYLVGLAEQAALRAGQTGEDQYLYNLTPDQRRIIHMALSESSSVMSESHGEGEGRYIIVKPK